MRSFFRSVHGYPRSWAQALLSAFGFFFTFFSALCGLAPSLGMLVIFRAAQGLAGGGLQPSVQAILADSFPPQKRGMAMALYTLPSFVRPFWDRR